MQSVDAHLEQCLAALMPPAPHALPLLEAAGCVLAEDVESPLDIPLFDNSSMDGYAVRLADLGTLPVVLPVDGDLPAGASAASALAPGTAVRIMTGAPVPAGAEAIVPVEWTDPGVDHVVVHRAPTPGQYVRLRGDDVSAGQVVLRAGARLTSSQVALLASVGRDRVRVHPRPRVVVLPSGDELVPPGKPLGPGQIHDSNGYGLVAAARSAGAEAEHGGIVTDSAPAVLEALRSAAARADLLITSGGVSAGAYDVVKEVLSGLGTVSFQKVGMQPGMPQGFGTVDGTPIFTLPGNPVSSLVSFELFVRPALQVLSGGVPRRRVVTARAAGAWSSPAGKRQFTRGVLSADGAHGYSVTPVGGPGSHLLASLASADCLAVVPEDVTSVELGDELECYLLEGSDV
ncbi:gephyrin-like molybdotransferase Glp [Spongisporangium articulatum]|uniref:Molybdopterin molybdenumtransferase n=1 Tax=Spongisporangium articulatum TaxID=3362603 RepID=A0ABW8AQX7_9ACTN